MYIHINFLVNGFIGFFKYIMYVMRVVATLF